MRTKKYFILKEIEKKNKMNGPKNKNALEGRQKNLEK
jgi:hypothetical protein